MRKKKPVTAVAAFRDASTEEAVLQMVAAAGGDIGRRMLARRLGHRPDFASALNRLQRRREIEIVTSDLRGLRTLWRVRLIGNAAKRKGAGMVRVGGES